MPITRQIVTLDDYNDRALELMKGYGVTDQYSTSSSELDDYLQGGYGKDKSYEIVVLFGDTGIGKSTVALNMLKEPIKAGKKVGLFILEDDVADANVKLRFILGDEFDKHVTGNDNIHVLPDTALDGAWVLEDLIQAMRTWFEERDTDIILLDHLQFAFESADSIKGENEWLRQRVFMRKLVPMVRELQKTVILVSHITPKAKNTGNAQIAGSGGIPQAATKTIEVYKQEDGEMFMRLWKSRHTATPNEAIGINLIDNRLSSGVDFGTMFPTRE